MKMHRIDIEKQPAQIGVRTTHAKLKVDTQRPPQMKVSADMPEMKQERKQPAFSVDWQRVRAESGLAGPGVLSRQSAVEAQQQVLDFTGQSAQDGNYVSRADIGGNRVAELEKQRNFEPMKEVNLGSIPKNLPDVTWEPGFININWSNTQMRVEWDSEYMPTFSVEPYTVEIFLREKPYIKITVVEEAMTEAFVDEKV